MITSLLIANRGEIACRIIRTARAMGIRTVAVYSDADAKALHVRQADEAVHIGPSPARESYLVGEKIIAAAKATGAEAIHPGYGFLSENADFAQAVIDARLIWVGPKPASIRAMGLKDAAKKLMQHAGVPTTPGYLGEDQAPDRLEAEAAATGYPVLIKAVAGGGGKGMRRVDDPAAFQDALTSCKREAASSFGDDRVLIEKYILSPRHIEVQVFGDSHGNVVHLFERDCSLQRRHQKVIEEAPAPGMDETTREAVCAAAVRAAQAVDYEGAGTIEFIADASDGLRADRIWFMEMNTRLQVEHPVTEEITGVDLVEWQLRVASGEPLPKRQDELSINGWAIEARLYAEDPASGFLPSIGRLERFGRPVSEFVRIEAGVEQGDDVSPYYDPMIAKFVTHETERDFAIMRLADYVRFLQIWPIRSNAGLLHRALVEPRFIDGDITTGFLDNLPENFIYSNEPEESDIDLAATTICDASSSSELIGFRLNQPSQKRIALMDRGLRYDADLSRPIPSEIDEFSTALESSGKVFVTTLGRTWCFEPFRASAATVGAASDGAIVSPMPGRIIAVEVAAGQAVVKGQKLVTLEAMKMEHTLTAPFDGTITELKATAGAQVSEGTLLVKVESS